MSTSTTNYNLIKPQDTDNADLKVFVGQNMDKIDTQMKTLENTINGIGSTVTASLTGVRYIRDTTNGNNVNINNYWSEIQAMDGTSTNVALNKTVTGSGTPIAGTLALVTDGTIGSASGQYVAMPSGVAWVQIDLGSVMDVKSVVIYRYYADGRTFHNVKTEVSQDGTNWYAIYDSSVSGEYAETASGKTITFDYTNIVYTQDPPIIKSSFRAYPNAVTNIATANTLTKVSFQVEDYDIKNEYDTGTSKFTANQAGLYVLSASCGIGTVTTPQLQLAVYKNSAIWFYLDHFYSGTASSATAIDIAGSSIVKLLKGDTIEIYVASSVTLSTTNGVLANSQRSYFSMSKIG